MQHPDDAPGLNEAILRDASRGCWLWFASPLQIVTAVHAQEVREKLHRVEEAVERQGLFAAGFIAYEAAPAFDPTLQVKGDSGFPLMWFGLYESPRVIDIPPPPPDPPERLTWQPTITPREYARAFRRIKEYIRAGDTYQVNYTLRLHARCLRDPWPFFLHLLAAQEPGFGAYLSTREWTLCSASPELFLCLQGGMIESRPMKGTTGRGLWTADDALRAAALQESEKERAENVMIVDMVRNDLGRIAEVGSVHVPHLFQIEQYPTLWQMTSTVRAKTGASPEAILEATFPPASITGAPKIRTMEIIAELEATPRRIYTGAIGFIAPGRRLQLNVAIRTVLVDREAGRTEYGTGGGIVWDSELQREQGEWRTKARILQVRAPVFELLETMLWTPEEGYRWLDLHLRRLGDSARYFGFAIDLNRLSEDLSRLSRQLPASAHRIRLLLARDGSHRLEAALLSEEDPGRPRRVALARSPVDRSDVFLYHKTTHRHIYEAARSACPGYEDVILYNREGEVTEATISNVVAEIDGALVTPPVRCGLLAGTHRARLLEQGRVAEQIITIEELMHSPRVYLINSVRGMYPVVVARPGHDQD